MKIAFATQDKEHVDAHFGWAKASSRTTCGRTGTPSSNRSSSAASSRRTATRTSSPEARRDQGLRDPVRRRDRRLGRGARRRKIHPIKVPQPEPIGEILVKLQEVLNGTPPPWLRKALAKDGGRTFDFDEDDEVSHG
jgi:nitrogen fixation protein NifX